MDPIAIDRDLRRLLPLAILVVGLHAALLAVPMRSARPDHAWATTGQMEVRLIATSAATPSPAPLVDAPITPIDVAPFVPAEPPASQTRPVVDSAPMDRPAAPEGGAAPDLSPPPPLFALVAPGGDADSDYFPRALLSRAPTPLEPVLIEYPAIANDHGHHVSELTLFIDETGRVARVRVEGAALPPALEDAARAAFTGAQFRPGEADGRAVKSRIRVEVVFDHGPPGKP